MRMRMKMRRAGAERGYPGSAWVCCWLLGCQAAALQLPPCEETDYHFEYTECDSSGSRWRVAVPNPSVECSGLPDPVKGKECSMLTLFILQNVTSSLCYLPLYRFLALSLMS
ncbi:endosome/lysosome-associated apoptosis and autophagy regulator family member 2 [Grus japonensis]|uniref:Endosome/lysosome-associated apoptosis and autophagy regulator family member 2 n=1 Tax=Grus japonensis TaxID=30415 RepID=A0ABC9VQ83_GRUJA